MTQQAPQMSQEQLSEWVREQFQRANKHLAENGVVFESVVTEESRYLAPYVAVWKLKSTAQKFFWVISGDVPCDFVAYENAKNAREAIRHFSFNWQLQAENLQKQGNVDQTKSDFIEMLISRAEGLYDIYNREDLWKEASNSADA
ncbi:DUF4826 family protein [Aliiglaciecola sp.]|nr:DUF4826 family protein [Aliiglaciecola sp.]